MLIPVFKELVVVENTNLEALTTLVQSGVGSLLAMVLIEVSRFDNAILARNGT